MPPIEQTIQELWKDHIVMISLPEDISDIRFGYVSLNIFYGDRFDVNLFTHDENIGFITIKKDKKHYQIINDVLVIPHPGISKGDGIGIGVKEPYQDRNIGYALLSLGIGIAQKDFRQDDTNQHFRVTAHGILGLEEFYKKYGFQIIEKDNPGSTIVTAVYTMPNFVPELNIE